MPTTCAEFRRLSRMKKRVAKVDPTAASALAVRITEHLACCEQCNRGRPQ